MIRQLNSLVLLLLLASQLVFGLLRPLPHTRTIGTSLRQSLGATASMSDSEPDLDGNVENTTTDLRNVNPIIKAATILHKFSRPHTIKGTILASSMGVTRALIENPGKISLNLVPKALIGLFALLCGNAYIVGLNQIYDVKIDEVNKPFLPIAAKLLSPQRAWQLVLGCLFSGVTIVKTCFSPQIFGLYCLGVVCGTLYSIPPFHLKRFPILAGLIIATVRGFLLNFGVYYAVREALSIPFKWNPVVGFISTFMTVFATVIAITKDLPDVEGDKKYNIETFAGKFGIEAVSKSAAGALCAAYTVAISLAFVAKSSFKFLPMAGGHTALLTYFLFSIRKLDLSKTSSVKRFYKVIWNLFYLEYCLYPFI